MPRRLTPDKRRTQTLLLRLTEAEFETLEVAAHLERVTPNAYAYQLLRDHLVSLQTNDHVQQGLELLRSYEASKIATTPFARTPESRRRGEDGPIATGGTTD